MKRKIISVILIIMTIILVQNFVYAGDKNSTYLDIMTNIVDGKADDSVTGSANTIAQTAVTVAQVIAVGVAIIMLIVLAMKYMISAPGERATIKKHAVVYIVGAIVMFASTGILEIIKNLAKSIS